MNYQKIYNDICKRGQERILPKEVYTEKHHIIPKCLGGNNSKENLTKLTAKEHFICHLILARKLYPKICGLWKALHKMMYSENKFQKRYIPSGRIYESIRIEINKNLSGEGSYQFGKTWEELFGAEVALRMKSECSNRVTGRHHTDETKEKCRLIHLGKPKSNSMKENLSKARKGKLTNEDNPNAKRILHLETGLIFNCQKSAAEYFNVTYVTIFNRTKRGLFEILGNHRKL